MQDLMRRMAVVLGAVVLLATAGTFTPVVQGRRAPVTPREQPTRAARQARW